jgi:ubiquinone/menaquinone biosynthesis C-methylase UbiE
MNGLNQLPKRLFAWGMAQATPLDATPITHYPQDQFHTLADLKRSLFGDLQGTVLEIGPGTGANFAYLPKDIHWIGVEPNPFMHPYLRKMALQQGFQSIELHSGRAEQLPLEEAIVEVVISSHVLCSVQTLGQVLEEVQRVLKPGGSFIFVEHVAAECCTWTRRVQDGVAPLWQVLFDHCHPNRETWRGLEAAGFAHLNYQHFQVDLPLVGPHIAGVATMPP